MKKSIGKKLMTSGLIVLVVILLVIVANQVVLRLFKNTSTKLVIEYHELDAIQEFKFSLSKLLISTNTFVIFGEVNYENFFNTLIEQAKLKLDICRNILTKRHELSLLNDFEETIIHVDQLAHEMFRITEPGDSDRVKKLLLNINHEINNGLDGIDRLLSETKGEIIEYEGINNTVIWHSTITVFTLGIIIVLIIVFGGLVFIKSITKPINELVSTTIKISEGDRSAKVKINTNDEFQTLAESFNQMLETLEQTTVSKDYLYNILDNMFNALIVTDNQFQIRSVNNAALDILEYKEDELINQSILVLFDEKDFNNILSDNSGGDFVKISSLINAENSLKSRSGKTIPSLLSCAILKNQNYEPDGLIIVAHDLTERNAIERKLEQTRKERLIDINEAQEKERLRIATDLHDGLGQMLTAVSYSVQNLYPKDEALENPASSELTRIQQQIDGAIREAKNLAHNLIPIVLQDFGLIVAIENLIARANETYQTRFRFDAFDFDKRIDPKQEKVLYRICQESLNNIVKHASAENAYYQIFWQDSAIVLVIEDDGKGFDINALHQEDRHHGIGLISIRERVLAFDGNFTLISEPGRGTEIVVEIPYRKS